MAYKAGDVCRVIDDCDDVLTAGSIVVVTGTTTNPKDVFMYEVSLLLGEAKDDYDVYPMYENELDLIKQE